MDRYHNGEQGRRRDDLGRDAGSRSFRDHDEQDFTQRSFASARDAERARRYAGDRFPEDTEWRDIPDRDERFGMSRYEPEYGRPGGWPRDDRDRAPYGTGQWQREGRPDPGAWEGRSYEGRVWEEDRGWDARVQEERGRRRDVRGGEGSRDEPARYGRGPDRDLYGGHRSRQGWRDQHGWGRDIARDLDADSDPYGGRFAGRGPKSYQRGDERVREDVCDRLTADARVDASDITVHVQNGEVTLEGTVDDRAMKRRAEDTADAVDGVRQVHNRLTVQNENRSNEEMQPFQWGAERGWRGWDPEAGRGGFATRERGDDATRRFRDDQGRDRGYGASVAGGYVGHDQPDRHRDSMRQGRPASMRDEQRGAWLGEEPGRFGNRGPKGYQRSDDRIREDVCDRLTADDGVDATNITVRVEGGEVTLEGSIDDRIMKRRAEDCADAVSGVRQVHNRLVVQPRHEAQGQGTSPLGTKEPATSIGTSAASGSSTSGVSAGGTASASRGGKG